MIAARLRNASEGIDRRVVLGRYQDLEAAENEVLKHMSVKRSWNGSTEKKLVEPCFCALEVARDLAYWGYVRDTTDAGTIGDNSENGLALENRRRGVGGEDVVGVPALAVEFKTTQIRITTELCEFEKTVRHYNL